MEQKDLDALQVWFNGYVKEFFINESGFDRNIQLKVEHTGKVFEVMGILADAEGLPPEDRLIARAIALLHDVGRFPQYRRWKTFRDRDSDNHARLAVEVIREHKLLNHLPGRVQLLIEEAVRFHNLIKIPLRLKSETDVFLRLIRDADKLDIWRVFVEHFDTPPLERASAALLGFPHKAGVSEVCLAALKECRIVELDTVNCVNDFKILLLSWVYDLSFAASYRLLQDRGFISELVVGLPDTEDVKNAISAAQNYVLLRSEIVSA